MPGDSKQLDKDDVRAVMWMTCKGIESALLANGRGAAARVVHGLASDLEVGELSALQMVEQVAMNLESSVREAKRITTSSGLIIPGGGHDA